MLSSNRRALVWSFAERYLGLLVSIGSTVVLSRLLTPSQVGVYSLCAAFTAVAGILRDFGVSEYLIQEKDLTRDKMRAAYGLAFVIAWTIGLGIFASRDLVANFYNEPQVAEVLLVLTLHFLILPISSPTFAMLNRELAFKQIFYLQLACNTAQAVVSVSLAFLGFGVMALAWGPIANVAVQSLILMWLRPADLLLRPGFREVRTVLRFGSMYVATRAIEVLTRNFHEPVIAKQFDFASVGLFSRAFGLIDLFHANVGAAVVRVATPAFAVEHRAARPLTDLYARATAIFVSISWPFFGFIALMAEPIIRVMFGDQWLAAAPIASALAVSIMPTGLYTLAPQMLSATGHVASRLMITLRFSPVHLVGVVIASHYSLVAVAVVWFFSGGFLVWLYLHRLKQVLTTSIRELLRPCRASAGVALASIAAQGAVAWLAHVEQFTALPTLVAVAFIGALAWLAAARAFSAPAYVELLHLLDGLRAKLASRTPGNS